MNARAPCALVAAGLTAGAAAPPAAAPAAQDSDIVGVAKSAGKFKTLLAAAKAAGLVDALKSKGPITVLAPDGTPRRGATMARTVFGPTCDSLDQLPGTLDLPADLGEGDYVLFHGMGAYGGVTATRFNGYGRIVPATVQSLI